MTHARKRIHHVGRWTLAIVAIAMVAGCYKAIVRQGNVLDKDKLEMLEEGMTHEQVKFLLGNPVINDPFDQATWVYVQRVRQGGNKLINRKLQVRFKDGAVATWSYVDLTPVIEEVQTEVDEDEPTPIR